MADRYGLSNEVQKAGERLYEDERLRSNLTDDEAQSLLGWAERELDAAAEAAQTAPTEPAARGELSRAVDRIRAAVAGINDLIGDRPRLSESQLRRAMAALLYPGGRPSAEIQPGVEDVLRRWKDLSNRELIDWLAGLTTTAWRDERKGRGSSGQAGRSTVRTALILVIIAVVAVAVVWSRTTPATRPAQSVAPPAATVAAPASEPAAAPPPAPTAGEWYQVFFTAPQYPDTAANHVGGPDVNLTEFINSAQSTVDVAIYQLDLPNVTEALLAQKRAGRTVRVATDQTTLEDAKENAAYRELRDAGITVVGGNKNAIMHNKYVVVDGKAVWTGSLNFTTYDTYRYNNNAIRIESADLARNYTAAFEKMWRENQFGRKREPGGTTPVLTIGGSKVENYFAPEDGVAEKIIARLKPAAKSIDFMAFSFTDDNIGNAMMERAKGGVRVRGVFETTGSETRYSEYGRMKQAGLDVLQDGNPYLMHHKVIIVDNQTVIFGSFNFSVNAEEENDENLLIIDNAELAQQFTAEFEKVYAQAKNPPR